MTAWTRRELDGWRNMVLKGQNTLFLRGKVRVTEQQHNTLGIKSYLYSMAAFKKTGSGDHRICTVET